MLVHPGFLALLHIFQKGVCRHGEDGDDLAQRVCAAADAAGGFEAVHHRHLHIHQDHVILAGLDADKRIHDLLPVGANFAVCALGFQQQLQDLGVDGVVLGAEEVHPAQGRDVLRLLRERLRLWYRVRFGVDGEFQHDLKAGALAGGTLYADGAAHQIHDVLGDGHAQTRALHPVGAGALLAGKGVKKGLLVSLAHANAVILYHKAVFGVVLVPGQLFDLEPDVPAAGGILDRVGENVHQHLIQAGGVGQQVFVPEMGGDGEGLRLFAGLCADHRAELVELLGKVHRLNAQGGLAALDAAHIQNVVDDAQQQLAGAFQLVQVFGQLFRLVQLVLHQGRQPDDGVHGGADVVAHVGEEVRLGLAGLFGYFQCGFHGQRGLVLACAVRQIHDALFCTLYLIDKAGHVDIVWLAGLLMDKLPIPFLLRTLLHLHQTVQP